MNNQIKTISKSPLQYFTQGCIRMFERYLPDPLVIVIILTIIVIVAGVGIEGKSPANMLEYWMGGFWKLHTFAMQMILILVAGYIVATTPLFKRFVKIIVSKASTPGQAIILVTLVSLIASWINWGIGLVIGAILAKEMARQIKGVDYRLLVASAYSGFIIWHAGLSGAVPLSLATQGHPLQDITGLISIYSTLFSPLNIGLIALIVIVLPSINYFLMKGINEPYSLKIPVEEPKPIQTEEEITPAERIERSSWLSKIIASIGFIAVVLYAFNGGGLNLNIVIFTLIFSGIFLHKNLQNFLKELNQAVRGASGVIIQFPFYAGVMGMMSQSGLASDLAQSFVNIANTETLPFLSFLSAGVVNLFIPSGGGQWAVQGPILMEAAKLLNADMGKVAIAFAWGDSWTNLLQPFWALPALAIAGLKARDIMGYCSIILLVTGAFIGATLLIF